MVKFKIRRGDEVVIISGKDKGKKGSVLKVLRATNRVVVSGVNILTRHIKPSRTHEGGIVHKEGSIHISNVSHVDPKTGASTKVGMKIMKDGTKVRFAKKSGEVIAKEGK